MRIVVGLDDDSLADMKEQDVSKSWWWCALIVSTRPSRLTDSSGLEYPHFFPHSSLQAN